MTEQDERLKAISALILFTEDVEKELECKIEELRRNPKLLPKTYRAMFDFYEMSIEILKIKQREAIFKLSQNNAKQ